MTIVISHPLTFEPILQPRVWGGDLLQSLLGKRFSGSEPVGESWEVCGLADCPSRVNRGPLAGESLAELWNYRRWDLMGVTDKLSEADNKSAAAPCEASASLVDIASREQFPLLIKWLDCRERLSVQVHPNDEMARTLLGQPNGKSEAWVVIHAYDNSRVFAGLKPGVTRAALESHVADGSVEQCLHAFVPRVGDCISLPAGTIHAASGVLLAEVQQPSDTTFRLYDWNRLEVNGQPRSLHCERALQATAWPQPAIHPQTPTPLPFGPSGTGGELLLQTPFFHLERFTVTDLWTQPHVGEMTIWMVLAGSAELLDAGNDASHPLNCGSTVLIPAASGLLMWRSRNADSPCTLLCVRLPRASREALSGTT